MTITHDPKFKDQTKSLEELRLEDYEFAKSVGATTAHYSKLGQHKSQMAQQQQQPLGVVKKFYPRVSNLDYFLLKQYIPSQYLELFLRFV